jgi:hypothetical protein
MSRPAKTRSPKPKAPLVVACGIAVATFASIGSYLAGWTRLLGQFEKLQKSVH